ncbi:sugar transferase [Bacillus sp. FJAT-50079]|uniref:sugar transferase n=1 Tax=Bacillus sp. FJAT-50079 TaxID=2833577 RepID=UPI001BCA232A|nr:sugar transferase [Bacillus sp. FJAT-50079]
MKRCFDLISAIILLLILFPIITLTAFLIKWKLGGSVLFKQERPGLHGIPFTLYKFRTMTEETDENGELLPDYARISAIGKFLRKYSLDELPQLVNVLKGDISLVGPRPLLMEYLPLYTGEQAKRHLVKPGITGWAQVNGRNAISWEEKFELDIWYVNHQSLLLDLKILLLTIKKVLISEGINQPGSATVEGFKGTKSL